MRESKEVVPKVILTCMDSPGRTEPVLTWAGGLLGTIGRGRFSLRLIPHRVSISTISKPSITKFSLRECEGPPLSACHCSHAIPCPLPVTLSPACAPAPSRCSLEPVLLAAWVFSRSLGCQAL